jgi:hypothetical protein
MAFDLSKIFADDPVTGGPTSELGNLQVVLGQLSSALDPQMGGHIATGLGKGTLASNVRARQNQQLMQQLFSAFASPQGPVSGMKMDPETGAIKVDMTGTGVEEAPGEGTFGTLEEPTRAPTPGTTPIKRTGTPNVGDILSNFP